MSISVCYICKNEENFIGKSIESIKDIAGEIIVVDTGSKDNSKSIANSFNSKIVDFAWNNDFSSARNKSLELATGDWILILDCDEIIEKTQCDKLISTIEANPSAQGICLTLVNVIDNCIESSSSVLRLFKNNSKFKFTGKIHEQIINSITSTYGDDSIIFSDIEILHYGYDTSLKNTNEKSKRNLQILNSYLDSEKDGYYYYALGNEYAKNFTDRQSLLKSLEFYNKSLQKTNYKKEDKIYDTYLALNIVKLLMVLERFENAIIFSKEIITYRPGLRDLYFLISQCYCEQGKFNHAKEWILKYKSTKNAKPYYPNNNFDKINNLDSLINDINGGILNNDNDLLTTIYIIDNYTDTLPISINSINGISKNVVILDRTTIPHNLSKEKELGANIIKINRDDNIVNILKTLPCTKWLLILNNSEFIPFMNQKDLIPILETTSEEAIALPCINPNKNTSFTSIKIFKNTSKLFNSSSLNTLSKNLLDYKKVYFSDIFTILYQ